MKRFLKRRWHGIPLGVIVSILVVVLAVGGVLAAGLLTKTVPATIRVTPAEVIAEPGLGVYSNIECTLEVTSFPIGPVEVGSTFLVPKVWVKNIGDQPFATVTITTDLDPGIAILEAYGWPHETLGIGEKTEANLRFTGVGETSGIQEFNIMFNGSY